MCKKRIPQGVFEFFFFGVYFLRFGSAKLTGLYYAATYLSARDAGGEGLGRAIRRVDRGRIWGIEAGYVRQKGVSR